MVPRFFQYIAAGECWLLGNLACILWSLIISANPQKWCRSYHATP